MLTSPVGAEGGRHTPPRVLNLELEFWAAELVAIGHHLRRAEQSNIVSFFIICGEEVWLTHLMAVTAVDDLAGSAPSNNECGIWRLPTV